jgi:hypothetical protein
MGRGRTRIKRISAGLVKMLNQIYQVFLEKVCENPSNPHSPASRSFLDFRSGFSKIYFMRITMRRVFCGLIILFLTGFMVKEVKAQGKVRAPELSGAKSWLNTE